MNERITDRDIALISAYLDSRLSPEENNQVKARLQAEPQLNQLFKELAYTRRLLQSLPVKRSPRNFTISPEMARTTRKVMWLQPALSFVSIAAAVVLVVVFSTTFLLGGAATTAREMAPQAAMLEADNSTASASSPVIINWNPVLGKGGGGGGDSSAGVYAGGDGIGGAGGPGWDLSDTAIGGGAPDPTESATPEPVTEMPAAPAPLPQATPTLTEAPLTMMAEPETTESTAQASESADLSTLILGLPAEEVQGQMIAVEETAAVKEPLRKPPNTLIMIISGITAVLAGVVAIILRRR